MNSEKQSNVLLCPKDRTPLTIAGKELLEKLNRAITNEDPAIENLGGGIVEKPIAGGMVNQDGTLLYPIIDDIPVLLVDDAIALEQIK